MIRNDDGTKHGDLMVDEDELRALFAHRRPDAERFAVGVNERLAAARACEDEPHGDGHTTIANECTGFGFRAILDRAASVLPGLPDGGMLGKSWATILLLPLLLLVGVVATFVYGVRQVNPARHRHGSTPSARDRRVTTTFQALLPLLGSLLGIALMVIGIVFGSATLANTVTLVMMIAMLTLAWHVGQAARSGVTNAIQIGRTTFMLLVAALFGCVLWLSSTPVFDGDSVLGHDAVGWILVAGIAIAGMLSAIMERHMDPGISVILFLSLPFGVVTLELPTDTQVRVRQHLESLPLHPKDLRNWQQAASMAHALDAVDTVQADLEHVRKRLAQAIDDAPPAHDANTRVHPAVWTSAIELGLLDRDQLRILASRGFVPYRLTNLLEQSAPLTLSTNNGFLLDCLLASRELTVAEKEHLVQRIDASWPTPDQRVDALDRALLCVRWLDRLGRPDVIEARRDRLHELLMRHWVSASAATAFSYPGGFCTYPDSRKHATVPSTANALEIIEFVGTPSGLPLHAVHAFLRQEIHTSLLGRLFVGAVLMQQAEASMLLLREAIGLPDRGWLQILVGERTALAALLLVLLGMRAIWLAYRSERSLVGAMP